MAHRRSAAAAAVTGLALLSGCTPADLPLAAVWPGEDGRPVVTLRPCKGDQASHLLLVSWAEDAYMDDGRGGVTDNPLASLHPGQVWADGRAMSREEFDALVADKC